ncbi:hypothetical protein B0T14DRAFT_229477 [Immersiella caudata]|uniref:Uncharacterized protein n=1 Tax=Immersiella caudata TaxID=314043 RepID=A0AA39WRN9_9PEZI|nr:hypothetical protein B0T14DRAFT_229477 [Immersiella caudata]
MRRDGPIFPLFPSTPLDNHTLVGGWGSWSWSATPPSFVSGTPVPFNLLEPSEPDVTKRTRFSSVPSGAAHSWCGPICFLLPAHHQSHHQRGRCWLDEEWMRGDYPAGRIGHHYGLYMAQCVRSETNQRF